MMKLRQHSCPRARVSLLTLVITLASLGHGCDSGETVRPPNLSIAAAANLRTVLPDVVEAFQKQHPDASVRYTFNSSGNLFAQIEQGNRVDLFLSADIGFPEQLVEDGFAAREDLFPYAMGTLVLWVSNEIKIPFKSEGVKALTHPQVTHVAMANPNLAPYGQVAEEALAKAGILKKLDNKLVYANGADDAAHLAQSATVDAAFLAFSLVLDGPLAKQGSYVVVEEESVSLEQAGVILKDCTERERAESFRAFLCGPEGQSIIAGHGYASPKPLTEK